MIEHRCMKPAGVDAFVAPVDYMGLSNKEFAERFLEPMLVALKRYSGVDAASDVHDLHLRITVREVSPLEAALLSEPLDDD